MPDHWTRRLRLRWISEDRGPPGVRAVHSYTAVRSARPRRAVGATNFASKDKLEFRIQHFFFHIPGEVF